MAGFGDEDFYPDIVDNAAVLCWRLARNHPLPDGNKRAAWAALVMFIDLNSGHWDPDPPTSTTPNRPCWRSLQEKSTRQRSPTGYDSESSSN